MSRDFVKIDTNDPAVQPDSADEARVGGNAPLAAASGLNHGEGGYWEPRQVDRENASPVRQIARVDPAAIGFSAPSAESETKANAGAIGAALLERTKELVDIATWETAALILDLDEHAICAGSDPECDGGPGPCELESVLQEVSYHCSEDLSVSLDRHAVFNRRDGQSDTTGIGLQRRTRCDIVDEAPDEELLSVLNPLCETDLREGASDERV